MKIMNQLLNRINDLRLKYFRRFDEEMLYFYNQKMPHEIRVELHKDEQTGRYWAEISFQGKPKGDQILTEARDFNHLEYMVNDAVTTYFEIPYIYSKHLVLNKRYLPEGKLREKLKLA